MAKLAVALVVVQLLGWAVLLLACRLIRRYSTRTPPADDEYEDQW